MADELIVRVDATELLHALDKIGRVAERYVRAAAKLTAERIRNDAAVRLRRQTRGTGNTASRLYVEEQEGRFLVYVRDPIAHSGEQMPNLPRWLEFGTKYARARPFLFAAAQLEEGPHLRRISEAVQAAIDETGLGT